MEDNEDRCSDSDPDITHEDEISDFDDFTMVTPKKERILKLDQ
jgi:hypothetical protein